MLSQVAERRSSRTRATLGQLLDVLDVDPFNQTGLRQHHQTHPGVALVVAPDPAGRADPGLVLCRAAPLPGSLRQAPSTSAPHQLGAPLPRALRKPYSPARPSRRPSLPPRLQAARLPGTGEATIHQIISGAVDRRVVWQWIAVNPAHHAHKPPLPYPATDLPLTARPEQVERGERNIATVLGRAG